MSVYVDPIVQYSNRRPFHNGSCHMFADNTDELHEMAERIGMKRNWFQDKRNFPHYDLVPSKRKLAVANGAVEVSLREMVERTRKPTPERVKED